METRPTLVDEVFADLGSAQILRERQPTSRNPASRLENLYTRTFTEKTLLRLSEILQEMSGTAFGSLKNNRHVVNTVNRLLTGAGAALVTPANQPVRLRVVAPARSPQGYFQLRTADARQATLYSGRTFPTCRIVPQENPDKNR